MKSVDTKQNNIDKIIDEFKTCNDSRLKGKLEVTSPQSKSWTFYYLLGRVVWATGGTHPVRRYFRHLSNNCQEIDINRLRFRAAELDNHYWDYKVLNILHKRKKIEVETVVKVLDNSLDELLFEIIQQVETLPEESSSLISCFRDEKELIDTPITISSVEKFAHQVKKAQQQWQMWEEAGLRKISPNLAPILRKPEELKAQKGINERIYKTFVTFINGKFSLFDLSVKMKQGILPLTKSLLPYIKKGIIDLIEIPDLPLPIAQENKTTLIQAPQRKDGYLIACIDDSPQICQILEHIITKAGYRFMGIQDSVQALAALIENRPDLVFLDLVMPVANGYEVCSQIRRVSLLAHTPVVILTGNDGLVDRVRAKMVGASDFLAKPVEAEKVLGMIQKHVLLANSEQNHGETHSES
jgi:two-component system, chemotaxis family, response regulator PixG